MEHTSFDYTLDRIERLEREVGQLNEELRQSRDTGPVDTHNGSDAGLELFGYIWCDGHCPGVLNYMSQNDARPRGRPRSFDERYALEKAIQVFWSKGYDGVTIDDLVAGMGVGRPSLYSVFGDKRTLFLRVLRAYAERKGALAAKALLSPGTLRDSLAAFLRYTVESATEKGSARGCLLECVAPLVNDAEVRQFLQNAVAGAVALVEGRFRDGISAGEIPSDFPVAVRAIQVTDFARGLTMRAQLGTPRKTLLRDAEEAADLVLLPRRGNAAPER